MATTAIAANMSAKRLSILRLLVDVTAVASEPPGTTPGAQRLIVPLLRIVRSVGDLAASGDGARRLATRAFGMEGRYGRRDGGRRPEGHRGPAAVNRRSVTVGVILSAGLAVSAGCHPAVVPRTAPASSTSSAGGGAAPAAPPPAGPGGPGPGRRGAPPLPLRGGGGSRARFRPPPRGRGLARPRGGGA